MSPFGLACLVYLGLALPGSTAGLIWPSLRTSFHAPLDALGVLLAVSVAGSVLASAATGRILARMKVGSLVFGGTLLAATALCLESVAPSLAVVATGFVLFGAAFGAIDSAVNAYATAHFGARRANWMHASFGLGATAGPLLVTALLGAGFSWRWVYAAMAAVVLAVAAVALAAQGRWEETLSSSGGAASRASAVSDPGPRRPRRSLVLTSLAFIALEAGIESAAGIWGYVFLTAGRGLSRDVAGAWVSAYWAMMLIGRMVLGPVAERVGASKVLAASALATAAGAGLMTLAGPTTVVVAGFLFIGLGTAAIFPLFTLTTPERMGGFDAGAATRAVSLQVAMAAVGGAALPAGIGVVIGLLEARALASSLLVLGVAMCALYGVLCRLAGGGPAGQPYR